MAVATAWIAIHVIDELTDSSSAIPDHVRRHALGTRDELAADDQQPVVIAGYGALDDRCAAMARASRSFKRRDDLLVGQLADGHRAALVAVDGLDDDQAAD